MVDSGEVTISSIELEGIQSKEMERRALINISDTSPQQSVPDDSNDGSCSNLSQESESEFFKYSYDIEKMHNLLKDGADPNRHSELGRTALHWAAGYRLPNQETQDSQVLALNSMLELLVSDDGVDINAKDEAGCTPLNLACRSSNYHAVQMLLSQDKVMVDEADNEGRTPLHTACMQNNEEIVDLLIKNKGDFFKVTNNGETPLCLACFYGRDKIVGTLLSSCSDEDRKRMLDVSVGDEGKAPLRIAYEWNHTKVANILLKHGADPNIFKRGSTDDEKGSPYQMQSLLANIDMTVLQIAAKFGIVNVVKVLLEGIPLDDDDTDSRMECAVYHSDADRKRDISTSLLLACKEGHVQVVKLLLEHNADVSHTDTDGHTALHIASKKGHSQVVKVLLDHDRASFINDTDSCKRTPLFIACEEGHVQVVKVLLEYDADATVADQDGLNPLDIAVEEGHRDAALAIVNSDQWEVALRNYIYKTKRDGVRKWCPCIGRRKDSTGSKTQIITPMRRIIMKLPDVARAVFDRCCVKKLSPDDPAFEITCNYEFLEDFDLHDDYPFSKWPPPSEYSSQNHCLYILANSPSSDLLKHPLASSLLDRKWSKYGRIVYYTNLIFYLIFVILLTSFALTVPSPNSTLCMEVFGNESSTFIDCSKDHFISQIYSSIASVLVIVYSGVMLIRELVQLIQFGPQYLTSFVNYIEVSLFIFTIVFASVRSHQCYCTHPWQWQVGVIAVFLSWIALIFSIRNAPIVGIYVVMFIKIFNNFMKVVILALLLVIAFAFPFYMMFYDPHDRSKGIRTPFITPWRTLLKTIIMTMGEYNIDILLLQDDKMNSTDVQYPVVTFSLLVVFVVLMPILFLNLLTSLAVGDTQEIQKSADTYRLILKVEFILPMEEFLRSLLRNALSILRKIHAQNVVEDFLEKLKQNLIIIGQEQKIYPNKSSIWKKFIGSLIEKRLVTEPLATVADVKHQIKPLSEEVKGLQSSMDRLLSIVRNMRNERGGGRERGRAGASEGAGNERERDNGEEQREV